MRAFFAHFSMSPGDICALPLCHKDLRAGTFAHVILGNVPVKKRAERLLSLWRLFARFLVSTEHTGQAPSRPAPTSFPLEEPDLTASTPEPAAPAASDDAVARVGKFLFTVAQSDNPPDDEARVRALTAWLLTNWKSDLEGDKSDVSSASSHCSVL